MREPSFQTRVREVIAETVPLPGHGQTAQRHRRLFEIGREDLSLARLVEAHWDALAILAEAGHNPDPHALYGVWASEAPGMTLKLDGLAVSGSKPFCSGASVIDRALVTVKEPRGLLIDLDLRGRGDSLQFDESGWKIQGFSETHTALGHFDALLVRADDVVGETGYYLERPGFWHGALGPAACWAGGAAGLVDWAMKQSRSDPHTLAHLGAMRADVWSMEACLEVAGREIDAAWTDAASAQVRALMVRHVIEQACTDVLRRLARAFGPYPLAMDEEISRRYQELDLYVRQSHAERDLETLGTQVRRSG